MNPELLRYLSDSYRHDILGESVAVSMPTVDPKLFKEITAELARINGLRLGANLINRDFVSWQRKRALERLLVQIEEQREEQREGPAQEG